MLRRISLVAALTLLLVPSGCRFDYVFFALEIEGDYPPGQWTEVICIDFRNMPLEIDARNIDLEIDIDPPPGMASGQYPKKLQHEMRAYDEIGESLWKLRSKPWKVNPANGRIETIVPISRSYLVPKGGRLCHFLKPFARALVEGYLMGISAEPIDP